MSYYRRRETLKDEEVLEIYKNQKGLCALTGREMTHIQGEGRIRTNISIDRIDSNRGYLKENIQLVCADVNKAKQELSISEFKNLCKMVLEKK